MKKEIILWLILSIIIVLSFSGVLDQSIKYTMKSFEKNNEVYLDSAKTRATKGFLVLTSVKTALSIIEGSSVGVGFEIEIGDIVQSILDLVDIVWRTLFASMVVLFSMEMLLSVPKAASINSRFKSYRRSDPLLAPSLERLPEPNPKKSSNMSPKLEKISSKPRAPENPAPSRP